MTNETKTKFDFKQFAISGTLDEMKKEMDIAESAYHALRSLKFNRKKLDVACDALRDAMFESDDRFEDIYFALNSYKKD